VQHPVTEVVFKMIVKATGPSILRVGFDPESFKALREAQKEHVVYHLTRILAGEGSAASEWEYLGMKVSVVPWERGPR
jgi:hypothetical protein